MRADLLHVVTAIANPIRWESRIRLYREFERHMLASGVHLTTVECAYGDRPFELAGDPRVNHVPVRARSLVWTKENLLNIGISRLPQDWKYVAWIDADIAFRRANWAADTVHALQQYDIVQPWTDCYDLGPRDEHLQAHRSFCKQWMDHQPVGPGPYRFAHPGYAWAATRGALEHLGGLIETASLGAADHHMALALAGKMERSLPGGIEPGYVRPIAQWQARATAHIAGNIGCIPGTIEHSWHGAKARRRYVDRWQVLVRHRFDPFTDLKRNIWGVFELAGNKPGLRRDIDAYMRGRDEDGNTMED
jgi:hypothetical protein